MSAGVDESVPAVVGELGGLLTATVGVVMSPPLVEMWEAEVEVEAAAAVVAGS